MCSGGVEEVVVVDVIVMEYWRNDNADINCCIF